MHWLAKQAQIAGSQIALVTDDMQWTFAQLHQRVNQWANVLEQWHLRNQRCAVLSHNDPDLICLIHALSYVAAPVVFLNHRLSAVELAQQLASLNVKYLFHDANHNQLAEEIQIQLTNLGTLAINLVAIKEINPKTQQKPQLEFDDSYPDYLHFDLDQIQGIFFTSGTSGKPKAVPLTYSNHYHSAQATAKHLGINAQDNWLLCLPLFHVGGVSILWRSVILGHGIVLLPRFSVGAVFDALDTKRITIISLVPTLLFRLLADPELPQYLPYLQNLKCLLLGGATTDPQLLQRCRDLGIPICPTYGMTEASSQITTLLPHELSHRFGSSGRPLSCIEIAIRDFNLERQQDHSHNLDPYSIGEIYIRGKNVFSGYLHQIMENNPENSLELPKPPLLANNSEQYSQEWFATGDIGYLDDDGYLYVLNRRHDLIISGGENIYPTEIEAILLRHPAITEACVIGTAHSEWGQQVTAVIVADEYLTLLDVQTFCETEGLGRYKLPKQLFQWDSLPKTATGKLSRQTVREKLDKELS
jgi:O-succinylbenzoic acid--CoA ligase